MKIELCMGCMKDNPGDGVCPNCGFDPAKYVASPHQLKPGTILKGQYLIGKALGEGGFGITYIGYDLNLQMKVAVKEYFPSGFVTRSNSAGCALTMLSGRCTELYEKGKAHFVEEARRLAKFFGLPGVVAVKDYFQENYTAYIVMEFVEGITLKELLEKEGGRMEVSRVLKMMKPTMESLGKIHETGMIHRDISPDNIMVDDQDNLKLIDFGAARSFIADDDQHSLTVLLKPGYSPEEQYRSRGNQGPWTDVYSLCATIYRAVTGSVPPEALDRQAADDIRRPSELGTGISKNQEDALMKGLSLNAKDRYQSMQELMEDLYRLDTGGKGGHSGGKGGQTGKAGRGGKKKSKLPVILAAGAAAAAVLAGIFLLNKKMEPKTDIAAETEETTGLPPEADETGTTSEAAAETASEAADTSGTTSAEAVSETGTAENEAVLSDTVIEWADAGMEQYIRSALQRPEGDITSSELAEMEVLRLGSYDDGRKVVLVKNTDDDPGILEDAEEISADSQLDGVEISSLEDLKWFPNLEILEINGLEISDFSALSAMGNLTYLDLAYTNIEDTGAIGGLTNLKSLYLSNTGITDISALSGLGQLRNLNLAATGITDITALSGMTELGWLQLHDTEIKDVSALSGMTGLTLLGLNDTKITDISALSKLTKLEKLWLYNTDITDISALSGMKNLVTLSAFNTGITDISALASLESLEELYLSDTGITDISVMANLKNLRKVDLENCTGITDFSPLNQLPNLTDVWK